jgi:aquaporin Z
VVLTAAGAATVASLSHGAVSRSAAATMPGLMVLAIILFAGAVSGAHLNPAVTVAFALRNDFPWRRVPGYLFAQLPGAVAACCFCGLCSASTAVLARGNRVAVSAVGRRC